MNKKLQPNEICHLIIDINHALDLLVKQTKITKEDADHIIQAYIELNSVFNSQYKKIK